MATTASFSTLSSLTTHTHHRTPKFLQTTFTSNTLNPFRKTLPHHQHSPSKTHTLVRAEAATLPVLSFEGTNIGTTLLDLKSAPPETARAVIHRGIITDQQNARRGTASTLTRAEVRGGGAKPYPQKSTGRARRGSQRTPLRPGGGIIFGPRPRDWSIKINKKEKRLAISSALASAAESMVVVEGFEGKIEKPSTKAMVKAMKGWGIDVVKEKSMILLEEVNKEVALSGRNIEKLRILTPRTLNLFDILNSDKLVLTKGTLEFLNKRYGVGVVGDEEEEEEEVAAEEVEEEVVVAAEVSTLDVATTEPLQKSSQGKKPYKRRISKWQAAAAAEESSSA